MDDYQTFQEELEELFAEHDLELQMTQVQTAQDTTPINTIGRQEIGFQRHGPQTFEFQLYAVDVSSQPDGAQIEDSDEDKSSIRRL